MGIQECCLSTNMRFCAISLSILEIFGGLLVLGFKPIHWEVAIISIISVLSGSFLLYGAIKYHEKATRINLVVLSIAIIYHTFMAIIMFVEGRGIFGIESSGNVLNHNNNKTLPSDDNKNKENIITNRDIMFGGVFLLAAIFEVFLWIFSYCFHKQIKASMDELSRINL